MNTIYIIKAHFNRNIAAAKIPAENIIHDTFKVLLKAKSDEGRIITTIKVERCTQGVTHAQLIEAVGQNSGFVMVKWHKVIEQFSKYSAELFRSAEHYEFFMEYTPAKQYDLL